VLTSRIVAQHYRAFGGNKVRRAHSESGRFFVPNRDSWRNPNVLELRLGNVDRESAIFFGESQREAAQGPTQPEFLILIAIGD